MVHYSLYLILLISINFNCSWLPSQLIILKISEKADMKNWIYHLQGRAMGEIQLISSWYHSLQHLKGSHRAVLQLLWKLQPKVPRAQQNFLAHSILHIPAVSVCLVLLSYLGVQQAIVHQILDLLHLLDLLNASSTALNPIQHIYTHPN